MIRESVQDLKHRLLAYEASRWIGVSELGGENKGQIIEMFQKAVDGKAMGEPWCMAFAMFCIQQVDLLYDEMTLQTHAKTHLKKTEHCMTLWSSSTPHQASAKVGHLVLWQYYKENKPTQQGHVGIIKQVKSDSIITIEGNTSDGSGIVREGDQVALRERPLKDLGAMRLVGFLKVW